jgi:hypothetical protein
MFSEALGVRPKADRPTETAWLSAFSNGSGVDYRAQSNVFAVGFPPADFTTTTRVQAQVTLVHRHIDKDKIGDIAERTDHGEWLHFRTTWR